MNNSDYHYKMTIAYDGTNYQGWQVQPNGISIQEIIQNTMNIILKEKVTIRGSGRTDTGVHAENQVAHFKYFLKLDKSRFLFSLNSLLPSDIRVKLIEDVDPDFHSQHSAVGKTYHYHLHLSPVLCPFKHRYSWHIHKEFDLNKLKAAATCFLGTHDFTSFANESHKGACAKDPVRTLKRIDVVAQDGGIRLEFEGNGFLYKMVRNLTGFLVDVARGRRDASEIPELLKARDRKLASKAAPASGLFLHEVHYS